MPSYTFEEWGGGVDSLAGLRVGIETINVNAVPVYDHQ